MNKKIVNALTVDVEDYFQVSAMAPYIDRAEWDRIPCRVERNVDEILDIFAARSARATFFTLGWVAQRYPNLVRRIHHAGHEVASHGYGHHRATDLTPEEFEQDIRSAKQLLEDITGDQVHGYRAPSFSIGATNPWAFDCLQRAGYKYSSSVYPIKHDHYGMPDAPRFAYHPRQGLTEFPVTTFRMFDSNFPAGGGGYFRFLPYALSRWAIGRVNAQDSQPTIFYFHPWEIDPAQPRIKGLDAKTRFRHYVNLRRTRDRLCQLLTDFRWAPMNQVFEDKIQ